MNLDQIKITKHLVLVKDMNEYVSSTQPKCVELLKKKETKTLLIQKIKGQTTINGIFKSYSDELKKLCNGYKRHKADGLVTIISKSCGIKIKTFVYILNLTVPSLTNPLKPESFKFLFSSLSKVIEYLKKRQKLASCDTYHEPLVDNLLEYITINNIIDIEENYDHKPAIFFENDKATLGICKQEIDRDEDI